eukprot:TRINITY_DN4119_c0_g1_i1.p1 TRINITY_DN4119_c0_g1~~TRINITY_DN4119_c0_g1_i1.p1  ORF type:complete len:313 (-),score=83.25 TRINITY_DN4119_c0_g1_i1:1535-2473(-)
MIGEDGLEYDEFFRSLQFLSVVEEELKDLREPYKTYLEAYTAGINAYVKVGRMPLEFHLLGLTFEEWTVKDCLLVLKYFSLMVSSHWQIAPLRTEARYKVNQELAERIFPISDEFAFLEQVAVVKGNGKMPRFEVESAKLDIEVNAKAAANNSNSVNNTPQTMGKKSAKGSNAWVVHGNYTESGKPLLANDPHLSHIIPSEIYLMNMKFPNGPTAIGAGFVGLPGFLSGRTEKVAFGTTMSLIEVIDIYWLKLNDKKTHYWYNNMWTPLKIEEVNIKVRDGQDVKYKTYKSHHGHLFKITPGMATYLAYFWG